MNIIRYFLANFDPINQILQIYLAAVGVQPTLTLVNGNTSKWLDQSCAVTVFQHALSSSMTQSTTINHNNQVMTLTRLP